MLVPHSVVTCPLAWDLFDGSRPVALDCLWLFPMRAVWADVLSSGAAALLGTLRPIKALQVYTFRYGWWTSAPPSDGSWCTEAVHSEEPRRLRTLCPNALIRGLVRHGARTYAALRGVECMMGPRRLPPDAQRQSPAPWRPPPTHPIMVQKGSVFHLR